MLIAVVIRNELAYRAGVSGGLGPYSAQMTDRYEIPEASAYRLGPAPNLTPWLGGSCPESGGSCSALFLFSWAAHQGQRSPFSAGRGLGTPYQVLYHYLASLANLMKPVFTPTETACYTGAGSAGSHRVHRCIGGPGTWAG